MIPARLYIENFTCHDKSFIDFSKFSSALIVGKVEGNDHYSNGAGKTSIFKAIEWVLFNQADVNLEKIIRDETTFCKVVFDFLVDDQEYRIIRQRTKKGTTDLTFLQKLAIADDFVYHTISEDDCVIPVNDGKFWKDISGRRTADTEKDLEKLIKINFKSFRNTVHFMQNDFSGLTTATPEKRKALFKDILHLMVYSKLEKLAKDKANLITKDLDKHKTLIDSLGDPEKDVIDLQNQLSLKEKEIKDNNTLLTNSSEELSFLEKVLSELFSIHKGLESKYQSSLDKEKVILSDKSKLETSIKDYSNKKSIVAKTAKDLIEEIKSLKEIQDNLNSTDFSQIEKISNEMADINQKIITCNVIIKNNISEYEELKIPVPDEGICKHCRQTLTEEHKINCRIKIQQDMEKCQNSILENKKSINSLNIELQSLNNKLSSLKQSKSKLEEVSNKLSNKNKELQDKKSLHQEYTNLTNEFIISLKLKEEELLLVHKELESSNIIEANSIKEKIDVQNNKIKEVKSNILSFNKIDSHLSGTKAVISHNIDQKNKDSLRLTSLNSKVKELEKNYSIYPSVLQAFSSSGIPNLMIQNVLDDLQIKTNELLMQLKPGLQLSFFIEKTKNDGTESDTLDIKYFVNGKERYYEQISGAMKLAVTFSLKLGLSFLLQEMIGTNVKFLLLDEIDQSLDKASVDAFANIIRFFQNDYKILIITHNDRMKDHITNGILVEQNTNMVSRAKIVDNW